MIGLTSTLSFKAHSFATIDRIQMEDVILVAKDTSGLDFTSRKATSGLGMLDNDFTSGIKIHDGLAISTRGNPLGLVHELQWVRCPRTRIGGFSDWFSAPVLSDPTAKESIRWCDTVTHVQELLHNRRIVFIGDRESDMQGLFSTPRRTGVDLLVRAVYNRKMQKETPKLFDQLTITPIIGTHLVALKNAKTQQEKRVATLDIHVMPFQLNGISLTAILAVESHPPPNVKPLKWILLTTLPVPDLDTACMLLDWYSWRWLIERYFFILKSGCRVEELQLKDLDPIRRAIAIYSIVAWRILQMTYLGRDQPTCSCEAVLTHEEWQALWCFTFKKPTPPIFPPSITEAIRWLAKIGGFLERKSDGVPGAKVLWKGYRQLTQITQMYLVFRS